MIFEFSVFSLIYFAGGVICLAGVALVRNRRPAPGVVPLMLFLFSGAIWTLLGAFEAGAIELSVKIICTKIMYTGVVSTGIFWLAFTLDYTGSTWWKQPRNLMLLSIIPLITLILAWTNEYHGWQWSRIFLVSTPLGVNSVWEHGPWYLVNPIYQYSLYALGIFVFCRFGLRHTQIFRKQVIVMLLATLLPVIGSILYVAGLKMAGGYDLTPLFISAAAFIYSFTVFRTQFFQMLPIAYKALVNSIPDGVLILDPRSNVIEMNPAAEKIMGENSPSIKGKSLSSIWPEMDLVLAASKDFAHTELMMDDREAAHHHGEARYLDISAVTLLDHRQKYTGTLVLFRDISEIKKAQRRIEVLYDKEHTLRGSLEEEINKRSQYSRAIVHELRTPLTSIIASSDMLGDQLKDPMQKRLLQNIRRSSVNLEQRVNELFELAKGEIGLLKIEPAVFDMQRLIEEIAAEMEPIVAFKGIKLRTEVSAEELPVMGDRSRLKQVILNLTGNAVKFTDKGEIVIKTVPYNADYLVVKVEDTGCGMERAGLENLFDPYRRKNREGGRSGLGIGLALSKIFVELHQGKIWAESTPGKGTAVSFTVPRRKI
jgi:PAS domain S-box-containing protein